MAEQEFKSLIQYDTYGGINFKQNWYKANGEWQKIFIGHQPGFDLYMGWRFQPNFGVEFGYEWTANKPYGTLIPNGGRLLGITNTGPATMLTGKARFKAGHADLNAFIPFTLGGTIKPEWIVSVGIAAMKPSIRVLAAPGSAFTNNFTRIESRSHAVFRGGFGIQTQLVEDVGIRILWRMEHTAVLRGRYSIVTENKSTEKMFRDSQSVAIGLFLKF